MFSKEFLFQVGEFIDDVVDPSESVIDSSCGRGCGLIKNDLEGGFGENLLWDSEEDDERHDADNMDLL